MAPRKQQSLAAVRIGYMTFLVPATNAAKLIEILSSAFECRETYGREGSEYVIGSPIELEYKVVRPSQLRHPEEPEHDDRLRHANRITERSGVQGLLPAPSEPLWPKVVK